MKKFIVTTTINKPTKATLKFCEIAKNQNWQFVIVGDLKTGNEPMMGLILITNTQMTLGLIEQVKSLNKN